MMEHSHSSSFTAVIGLLGLLGLGACSSDDDQSRPAQNTDPATTNNGNSPTPGGNPMPGTEKKGPLVIVTEEEGLNSSVHYLHVVSDWPSSGRLDKSRA